MKTLLFAQANYAQALSDNLNTVEGIWGATAGMMIGYALVVVGIRFMNKTK